MKETVLSPYSAFVARKDLIGKPVLVSGVGYFNATAYKPLKDIKPSPPHAFLFEFEDGSKVGTISYDRVRVLGLEGDND